MSLESIFIDAPVLPPSPQPAPLDSYKRRRFYGSQMERIRCRGCHGSATLFADINPGPRSHRSTRVRYFRCKTCRQVEIVEVEVP